MDGSLVITDAYPRVHDAFRFFHELWQLEECISAIRAGNCELD